MQISFAYDNSSYRYLIKDLGIGFGAFARLDRPLELKENHLLNMGESFIIVNFINENTQNKAGPYNLPDEKPSISSMKLRLKLFGGPSTGEVFYFRPDETESVTTTIRIGRSNHCDVVIEDPVLSKQQAHIYFCHSRECWILEDGAPGGQHNSLNGTWLYLNEDFEMYDGMMFKVNQVLF